MQRLSALVFVAALAGATTTSCSKASDDAEVKKLNERIDKLEAQVKKFAEVEEFVRPVMAQQQDEAKRRAAQEPDPTARFAVDVTGNPYIGPEGAAVTVIEAFDFA